MAKAKKQKHITTGDTGEHGEITNNRFPPFAKGGIGGDL